MFYKIKIKKVLSFASALLIMLSTIAVNSQVVKATDVNEKIENINFDTVSPLYQYSDYPVLYLNFSNKKIVLKINISGKPGTKFKDGTITLSKYSNGKYVTVKKWTGLSSSNSMFTFSNNDISAVSNVKYKLELSITAYNSSNSEKMKSNKSAVCP